MTEDDFKSPKWVELRADSNMAFKQASALGHLGGTVLGVGLVLGFVTVALATDGRAGESVSWGIAAGVFLVIASVLLWFTYKYNRRGKELRRQSWEAKLAHYYPSGKLGSTEEEQ